MEDMMIRFFSKGKQLLFEQLPLVIITKVVVIILRLRQIALDLDGCMAMAGLETAHNDMTIEEYCESSPEWVNAFRQTVRFLAKDGVATGICTGRSLEFTVRLVRYLFNPGECAFIIAEGGAVIGVYNPKDDSWEEVTPGYLDKDLAAMYDRFKKQIVAIGEALGAKLEPGKSVTVSFNPPKGKMEECYEAFRLKLKALGILDKVLFTRSKTAIDIAPLGVSKEDCLKYVFGDQTVCMVGDAPNDEGALSCADLNGVPGNGDPEIKAVCQNAPAGLIAEQSELAGTTEMMQAIFRIRTSQT